MAKNTLARNILASVMFLMALTTSRPVKAAICDDFIPLIMPCLSFLLGSGDKPGASCCSAAQKLNNMASTSEIRRELCTCFKQAAASAEIDADRAKMIPQACNVPIPIDPKVDCKKIS